jgi:integrase
MPQHQFDDLYISKLTCTVGRTHVEYFDTQVRGLYVDVMQSGKKSFRLRYRIAGKSRVLTIGDASILSCEDARQVSRSWLLKILKGEDPLLQQENAAGPTIQEFFQDKYLPYVRSYKRSWTTDESMLRNHIYSLMGEKRMSLVRPPDVALFVEKLREQGYAPGTCNRALVLLRYGFALAVRWQVKGVESNPVKDVKNLVDDNKIERYLTQAQMQTLMQEVSRSESQMLEHIVLFLIYTGARKREVLDAKWQDIDWALKSWRIPKTKSGKIRHIPLSTGAMQLLEKLRRSVVTPDSLSYIFASPKTGKAYVSFYYSWDAARKRAGLPDLRVHDLRHSFASFLVNAGRSLYEVQELLGHADIRTTSRYAHLSRERLIAAVEVVPMHQPWDGIQEKILNNASD